MARVKKAADVHAQRQSVLRKRLGTEKADAVLITRPVDIRYFTGFSGEDSWLLIPLSRGKAVIISDRRFEEELQDVSSRAKSVMRSGAIEEATGKLVAKAGYERVGFDPTEVTVSAKTKLAKASKPAKLVGMDLGFLQQRAIKDETEVDATRKAVQIQQKAFKDTCKWLKPGVTELEVAAYMEYRIRAHGGEGASFPMIIAAGPRSSLCHAMPTEKKVKNNDVLLIDWGAKYDSYMSDMTRTLALGRMPRKIKEIYPIVLESQLAAIEAIAPGVKLKDVDEASRSVIRKAGYGKEFVHGLGHGIGLEIHEEPRLAAKAKGVLEVGQIVTVEPGIYLPGIGGVRIEDDILVTETGHEELCDLPKGLDSATL